MDEAAGAILLLYALGDITKYILVLVVASVCLCVRFRNSDARWFHSSIHFNSVSPALMSIIFGRNKSYISICLAVWITYCMSCITINLEPIDAHCYKDVGSIAITFLFTIVFSAVIFAITCAYGWFARE
jgi:hypothetical protein